MMLLSGGQAEGIPFVYGRGCRVCLALVQQQ